MQEREKQTERERGSDRKRSERGREGGTGRERLCVCVFGRGGGGGAVCISKTVATHLVMVTMYIQHFLLHICYMLCNSVHQALFVTHLLHVM